MIAQWRCLNTAGPMAASEQLHMAAQMGNKLGVDTQQTTEQPECSNAQPIPPAVSIMEVVQQAPRLMELLTPECVKALTATCTQLRQDFRYRVTTIRMTNEQDQAMLFADKWPNLVMVVISTTVSNKGHMSRKLFTPYLSEREWAIMVRIQVDESPGDPTNWIFKQSVALVVTASHQSSQDMDTKAYGVALARLATEWVAKTRYIFVSLTSESACMNPFKHLHMGDWPCLERVMCLGQHGHELPVSCFWGEHSSNLQIFKIMLCSLGADIMQSLVTTCPHLFDLSLMCCKIDTPALACLNQARFSRLYSLNMSNTLLGWSGVQSLSSCDLPSLQTLTLNNINMSGLAAMYLAQGQWPKLKQLHLFDNQLNIEAVAYLVKGAWPLLQELGLSWTCVSEDAFDVLGVVDACKQLESTQPSNNRSYESILFLRSSFLVWPRLKALTILCYSIV